MTTHPLAFNGSDQSMINVKIIKLSNQKTVKSTLNVVTTQCNFTKKNFCTKKTQRGVE